MATRQITFKLDAEGNVDQVVSKAGASFAKLGDDVGRAAQAANSSMGAFGKVGSAIGGMATVAGGIVAANVFGKIAEGLSAFVSTGLSSVDAAQRLETGLGALLAMNNMYARSTETITVAVGDFAKEQMEATGKAADLAFEQEKLTAQINKQAASIQEQKQRIMQMGEGLNKNEAVAQLGVMEVALKGMQRELEQAGVEQGKLANIQQEYTTSTRTTYEQVMGLADAQKLAADQSKDLLSFVEKLAITSPFEQSQVAIVSKLAVAAGLGVEQTKSFTAGFLDLAAAVGIGSESLDFAADQLLQVAKVGKITSVDLRQLRRLGIDLEKIIGTQMGMSIEEFNEKAAKSPDIFNELFDSVTEFSQNTFAGTAEKMATSLSGLTSTAKDIFSVGAKNMLRPLVEAVGPAASDMLSVIADYVTGPQMAKVGESIPKVLFGAFKSLSGGGEGDLFSGLKGLGLDSSTAKSITDVTQSIAEFTTGISKAFAQFGAKGAALNILTQFGITHDAIALFDKFKGLVTDIGTSISGILAPALGGISGEGVIPAINQGITLLNENFEAFKGALMGVGAVIATVVGAGLLASLVASLTALLSPVVLLAGAIGLLTAAWMGNWGNIQGIVIPVIESIIEKIGILKSVYEQFGLVGASISFLSMLGLSSETVAQITSITQAVVSIIVNVATQLQAAFANIGVALGNMGITWETAWNALVTATTVVAGIVGAAILTLTTVIVSFVTGFASAFATATSYLDDFQNSIALFVSGVGNLFTGLVTIMTGLLTSDFGMVMEGIRQQITGTAEVIAGLGDFALTGLQAGLATVLSFSKGWMTTFTGIFDALAPALGKKFEGVWTTIRKVWKPEEWMALGESAIDGLLEGMKAKAGEVLEFIKSLAADSLKGLGQFWGAHSPAKKFVPLGMSVPQGIGKGINDAASAATGAMNNLMGAMNPKNFLDAMDVGGTMHALNASNVNDLKDIFKLNSKAAMDILASGGGEGELNALLQQQAKVWNVPPQFATDLAQANGLFTQLIDQYGEFARATRIENLGRLMGMASSFAGLGGTFAGMLEEQMGDSKAAAKALEELHQGGIKLNKGSTDLISTLGDQEKKMAILQAELLELTGAQELDTIAIDKKKMAIDDLSKSMEENRKKIEDNKAALISNQQALAAMQMDLATGNMGEQIAFLQDFLASGEDSIRLIGEELGGAFAGTGATSDVYWDRASAQEELNRLLEEQRRQEELITRQKEAQQKLDFMKAQLDLIKLGQELGGNIFQGITFGMDASIEDLLAATNAVTEAMVNQINQDLQIASPSKVMANIGRQAIGGLTKGWQAGTTALGNAVTKTAPIMAGVIGPHQGGGGNSQSYTKNQNMPITINNYGTPNRLVNDITLLKARTPRN